MSCHVDSDSPFESSNEELIRKISVFRRSARLSPCVLIFFFCDRRFLCKLCLIIQHRCSNFAPTREITCLYIFALVYAFVALFNAIFVRPTFSYWTIVSPAKGRFLIGCFLVLVCSWGRNWLVWITINTGWELNI